MLQIMGGAKRKNVKQIKGGTNMFQLKPSNLNNNLNNNLPPNQNFAKMPNIFPTTQVGGVGYGYTGGNDVSTFGGSYIPVVKNCTGAADNNRGGNNVGMSGGSKSSRRRMRKTQKNRNSKNKSRRGKTRTLAERFRRTFFKKKRSRGAKKNDRKLMMGGNCTPVL